MNPLKIHHADQIGDAEAFTDNDGKSYLAIGIGNKLKVRPLKYKHEGDFQEYTLPSQIASVTAVHRGYETLSQLLIVTLDAHIYSLHARHLEQLWYQEMPSVVHAQDIRIGWQSSENEHHLVVCFGFNPIELQLTFAGDKISRIRSITLDSSIVGSEMREYDLQRIATRSFTPTVVSNMLRASDDPLIFDCIQLEDAFVCVEQQDLILVCPKSRIQVLPQDEARLKVSPNIVTLPRVHKVPFQYIGIDPAICHVKLDEHRVLICWDGELFLLCIELEKSVCSNAKRRKKMKNAKRKLLRFEASSLGCFTPAKWMFRVEQNLFLAISQEYESFYFQLSSEKPFYKVVSFCNFSSSLPITHLEVSQRDTKSGPWTVESHSLLYSQGKAQRSLLVLEEKCIQAQEVLLTHLPSNDVFHSLWGFGGNMLVIEGRLEKVYLRMKKTLAVETQPGFFVDDILDAADDKVVTSDSVFCLQHTGEMKTVTLEKFAFWGKICKGCVVIVTSDDELECYDEKLNLVYQEKLASEYIFFQAERNNGSILFIAATYKGIIECRVIDLDTAQCSLTLNEIGKVPNSAIIERINDGFSIYIGCEHGCVTVFTVNNKHQMEPQHITLTTNEELLLVHLASPSRIVVRTPTETYIASINLKLKVCELSVVPSLRKAQSMINTSQGLVILDENQLKLIHLAETSTNQVHRVPFRGFIKTFSTISKDRHRHLVGIVLLTFKVSLFRPPQVFVTVVDIRTKKCSPAILFPGMEEATLEPFLSVEKKPACFALRSDLTMYLCYLMTNGTVEVKAMSVENTQSREEFEAVKSKQLSSWLTGSSPSLKAALNRAMHVGRLLNDKIGNVVRPLIVENLLLSADRKGVLLHRVAKDFQVSEEHLQLTEQLNAAATDIFSSPQVVFIGTAKGNIYSFSLRD